MVFPINKLLEQGISMNDLHSFLETPTGTNFMEASCIVLPLLVGVVAWIPVGFAVVPFVMDLPSKDDKQKVGDEKQNEGEGDGELDPKNKERDLVGCFVVTNILMPQQLKQLSDQVWAAIKSAVEAQHKSAKEQPMRQTRSADWKELLQLM